MKKFNPKGVSQQICSLIPLLILGGQALRSIHWQPGPEVAEPDLAAAGKRLIALKKLH
jgi:hypothetical protein